MSTPRVLLTFLYVSSLALAQQPVPAAATSADPIGEKMAARIVEEGIEKSQAMRLLRDLTGKVGHRLTGSDNFTKGCAWALGEFKAMGLDAHLEQWGEWKLVWNRGTWLGRVTKPEPFDMYVATDAWTAGTKGLQSGSFVLAPAKAEEVEADKLRGKWVIGKRLPGRAVREACAGSGLLGFVYRANDPNKEFPTRVRVFGNHQTAMKTLDEVPTIPEIAVQADHFDKLFALVEGGKEPAAEFHIENTFREGPIALNNVIAEIPGTEKPDEVVIVSAHLDSWHQVQGTTDNGTGATSTLESARILAACGVKPKRTIRFCLWGGEEQGLLGSRGYVQKHRTEMPKVSAVFNHDTGTNWAQSLAVTHAMKEQLDPVFAHVQRLMKAPDADWSGPVFALQGRDTVSGGGGSDHASFIAAGVPGLNWNLKGRSNYFQHTWHTQWDTIDVAIEEYQRHTSTVIALAAYGTANLDALLDRKGVVASGSGQGQGAAFVSGWFEATFDGVKVTEVKEGGRAAKMGVQKGDVLEKVGGEAIERLRDVLRLARGIEGDEVTFTFRRGETTFVAKAKKNDLPEAPNRGPGGGGGPRDTVPTQPAGGGTPPSGGNSSGGSGNGGGR